MKIKALALAVGLLAVSFTAKAPAESEQTIVIHAKRFAFVPDQVTLKQGTPVRLEIVNDDVAHSLKISGLNVNLKAKAGESATTEIDPKTVGDFKGTCGIFCGKGHGEMHLMVHVVAK